MCHPKRKKTGLVSKQGGHTTSMTPASVKVQIVPESVPSTPSWLGEVAIVAHVFTQFELLQAIASQVRFARARFGTYDTIDFVVVLLGYAVSGERTLEEFYERLSPFGKVFMGLFERDCLPSRWALSRYLAALDKPAVEALRTLFQQDLGSRPSPGPGGLQDREGQRWLVVDVDATKEAARQRALPHSPDLPAPHRRMDLVCAPGYGGRKRGEVVRSRTTVLQAHTQNWLGTFGGAGNGDYRGELLRAVEAITSYAQARALSLSSILIRLDGLYGDAAPLIDIRTAGFGVVTRGKDYTLLDLPSVQARLALPPDERVIHPESGASRDLFDCSQVPLTKAGPMFRMIVATHPAPPTPASIGTTRNGLVYEIFLTTASSQAFTASDVLHLYLHRGSFETVLANEDREQDPDRWASRTPCGQEFWQILSQWVWNIRLELGQQITPFPMRLTELVPVGVVISASSVPPVQTVASLPVDGPSHLAESAPTRGLAQATPTPEYGPPKFSDTSSCAGFAGSAFSVQPDGTLLCPAEKPLYPQERRLESNGSLRIVYAARIAHCRSCSLRPLCQRSGKGSLGPRRVSAVCQPLEAGPSVTVEASSVPIESESAAMQSLPAPVEPVSATTLSRSVSLDSSSAQISPAPVLLEPFSPPSTSSDEPGDWGESAEAGGSALWEQPVGYGPPKFSDTSSCAGFAGSAFSVQPDGTLLCPAEQPLYPQERRLESNGSLRIIYAAQIGHCRSCSLRPQCQRSGKGSLGPRRVSAVCQPLEAGPSVTVEASSVPIDDSSSAACEPAPALLEPASAGTPPSSGQTESESAPALLEPISAGTPPSSAQAKSESVPALLEPVSAGTPPSSAQAKSESAPALLEPISAGTPPSSAQAKSESVPALLEPASAGTPPSSGQTESESAPALLEPVSAGTPPSSAQAKSESAPALLEPVSAGTPSSSGQTESESAACESVPALLERHSPLPSGPVLWEDWPASQIRRRWLKLLRTETVLLTIGPTPIEVQTDDPEQKVLTRAERAHWRMSWSERLARNARGPSAPALSVTLHGLPASFARAFALDIAV
jgi:hypothetical protein